VPWCTSARIPATAPRVTWVVKEDHGPRKLIAGTIGSGADYSADPRFVDYYGRPWAKNWEQNFEKGWDKPEEELPSAITDIFK